MSSPTRCLTVVMSYYDNPSMLQRQLRWMSNYHANVRHRLDYIVVDDGSPRWPAHDDEVDGSRVNLRIYRIEVDVRWNQDAARNLGVHHAQTDWLLLTDIDHLIPEATIQFVMTEKLDGRVAYKFARLSEPKYEPYKTHPNSWLMSRALWDQTGGYDERLAGHYGTDGDFRDRVHACAARVEQLHVPIVRVPREVTPDASTTTLTRKDPADAAALRAVKAARDGHKNWRPLNLTFPWRRVL